MDNIYRPDICFFAKLPQRIKSFLFGGLVIAFLLYYPHTAAAQTIIPLYEENFINDQAEGWDLREGWVLDGEELIGDGPAWAYYGGGPWGDGFHFFEFDLTALSREGILHAGVQHSEVGRYIIGIEQVDENGLIVYLEKQYWDGGTQRIAAWDSREESQVAYDLKCPYHVSVEFGDGNFAVFLRSECEQLILPEPILTAFDNQPLPPGAISFESLEETDYVMIDNVVLFGPQNKPETDGFKFGECPEGELLYAENFDKSEISGWEWENGWRLEDGFLRGEGHFFANYTLKTWDDLSLFFRFFPAEGFEAIHINTRMSEVGRYFVAINKRGINLSKQLGWGKGEEFIDLTNKTFSIEWETWHTLEFRLRGEGINVVLDGEEQLAFRDPDPLPAGWISLETLDESVVLIDDLWVCGPADETPVIPPAETDLPDLSIDDVRIEPYNPVNRVQELSIILVNYGNSPSGITNLVVKNQEGGGVLIYQTLEAVDPQSDYLVNVELEIPEAWEDRETQFEVVVDPENLIREENEDNNAFLTQKIHFQGEEIEDTGPEEPESEGEDQGFQFRDLLIIGGAIIGSAALFLAGRALILKIKGGLESGKGEEMSEMVGEEPGLGGGESEIPGEEMEASAEPGMGGEEAEMGLDELPAAGVDKEQAPRFLQAEVFENSNPQTPQKLTKAFLAGCEHLLNVWIGELREGVIVAPGSFDFSLLPDLPSWDLQVYFWEPHHAPEVQVGKLTLFKDPQPGKPDPICQFTFRPQDDPEDFKGRLAVVYKNNVLQMLFLEGKVLSDIDQALDDDEIRLQWAEVKGLKDPDLLQKFDLVLFNESDSSLGAGVTFFGGKTGLKRASGLDEGIEDMTLTLKELGSPGFSSLEEQRINLVVLAIQGRNLYQTIQEQLGGNGQSPIDLRSITHLQLVSAVRDVFPLELVYVFPAPKLSAVLCPNALDAILNGKCDDCENLDENVPSDVVCPMGFLGMRSVIERHVVKPLRLTEKLLEGKDYQILVGLPAGGKNLSPFKSSLAAASNKVQQSSKQKLSEALQALFPEGIEFAENWDDWMEKVKKQPSTLLLVPHTKKERNLPCLEIGDSFLPNALITKSLLGQSEEARPLVFLLGCDTALSDMPYQGFAMYFSRAGAAITVITLSPIHESRAVQLAEILMKQCYQSAQSHQTFSEALLLARRTAMAKGYPEVLTLVADGDADWVLVER